jgi:DNA-binding CsgD family transcriptional regulator
MDQRLIDRIYECSFASELWPGVLDELAKIADARGGHFFVANTKVVSWTASATLREGMEKFAKSDIVARGQRGNRLIAAGHAGFLTEHDLYADPDAERGADPYYSELLFPAGAGWGAGTAISLPNGDVIFIVLERAIARGPVEASIVNQLDTLRPHLARSALMSARLQLERARAASETLALIGLPALVFDARGKVLAANHLIEALTDHIRWRAHDRLSLKDSNADALFQQAIATLDVEGAKLVRSFALRATATNAVMVAHVIPIRRTACDVFVRCAGVLVITPVTVPHAPPIELVQSLFDLTPAEARVARSLTAGASVEDIASIGGVSLNTIRTQVRGVLEKTGCRRQAEVVALLGGISISHG